MPKPIRKTKRVVVGVSSLKKLQQLAKEARRSGRTIDETVSEAIDERLKNQSLAQKQKKTHGH